MQESWTGFGRQTFAATARRRLWTESFHRVDLRSWGHHVQYVSWLLDNLSRLGEVCSLLTEQEVSKSWRALFSRRELSDETFAKAEALIDELRPESPLRHRLGTELDELRRMRTVGDPA